MSRVVFLMDKIMQFGLSVRKFYFSAPLQHSALLWQLEILKTGKNGITILVTF
jgi:hypothetical protein